MIVWEALWAMKWHLLIFLVFCWFIATIFYRIERREWQDDYQD